MSVKHYRQPTAKERAELKKRAEKEAKMTPAQKKAYRTKSTPQPKPKKRALPKSAVKLIKKATKKRK